MALELVPRMEAGLTTSFDTEQLDELAKPLSTALIRERKGPGGQMLKYIKGADAIAQANRIFGVGKWGYRVLSRGREIVGDQTFYTADVELYVLGCPFPFPGEGEGVPQKETVDQHAKARKEAVTDALKRALRHYGDQFGLCLYDEDSYVEEADGTLVQVKDVKQNARPTQQKRVVDAVPANGHKPDLQESAKPEPKMLTLGQLRTQAYKLGKKGPDFDLFVAEVFGRKLSQEELIESANLAKLRGALVAEEQKASTSGK